MHRSRAHATPHLIPACLVALGLLTTLPARAAADPVTVMLRSGEKVAGQLEDLENGTLYIRVARDDQRKLAIGDVAVIDFVGGASGLPETELGQARGDDHLLVLRNSSLVSGRLTDIAGGAGSQAPDEPRVFVFRTSEGEQRIAASEVGRVYVGRYPGAAPPQAEAGATGAGGRTVRVAATAAWVPTGIYVIQGQPVTFAVEGDVQLSGDASDRARAAGALSGRRAAGAPLPTALAGALVGRVGQNGQPFGIGDQSSAMPMPNGGELFLAVNDDERSDNQGEFVVTVTPGRATLPQRGPRR